MLTVKMGSRCEKWCSCSELSEVVRLHEYFNSTMEKNPFDLRFFCILAISMPVKTTSIFSDWWRTQLEIISGCKSFALFSRKLFVSHVRGTLVLGETKVAFKTMKTERPDKQFSYFCGFRKVFILLALFCTKVDLRLTAVREHCYFKEIYLQRCLACINV